MTRTIAYWVTTAIVALALFGSLSYLTGNEQVASGFASRLPATPPDRAWHRQASRGARFAAARSAAAEGMGPRACHLRVDHGVHCGVRFGRSAAGDDTSAGIARAARRVLPDQTSGPSGLASPACQRRSSLR